MGRYRRWRWAGMKGGVQGGVGGWWWRTCTQQLADVCAWVVKWLLLRQAVLPRDVRTHERTYGEVKLLPTQTALSDVTDGAVV